MPQETEVMPGPGKQAKQKNASGKDNEIAEIEEEMQELEVNADKGLFNKLQMVFEKLACTRVGQMFYEQCDRVLKVVEDTAKWGLPQDDNDAKLERPLPWVLFLSLIIWLRIFYFWFNIGSAIVGTSRVTPHSMVYSVQGKRRNLRAIKKRGLKAMRGPEPDIMSTSGSLVKSPSLMVKFRQLLGSAVCRPGQIRDTPPSGSVFARDDMAENLSTEKSSESCSTKRPRDDDGVDLNLTVDQMLDKYCNEDSEDDSDYVPNIEEEDERSTSTSSMSSDEEAEAETAEKHSDSNESALNTTESVDQTVIEVKENGGPKHHRPMPKPIPNIKLEAFSDADSGNEQVKTPQGAEYSEHFDSHDAEMHNTEVAPTQEQLTMPSPRQQQPIHQQQHKLTFNIDEEAQRKSTPGHQSAASANLGASAAEGSPTEFHSIFHPAPLIKVHSTAVHSTPKENEEGSTYVPATEMPELQEPFQQRKPNKQHQYQHNFHNKYRNKNRR